MRASIFGSLLVVSASLIVPGVASASASLVAGQPVAVLDIDAAKAEARRLNKQVKITAKTTEASETWANPDGTLTSEIASGPVRVKQGDEWNPVDLALVKQPNGTVGAKAHPRNLVLSAASGPETHDLASVSGPDGLVALQWSGALPEPTLAGDTATYAEVEPGIDLQVKVTLTGFQQLLVVKRKPTNAIRTTLPVRVEGLTMRAEASGGLSLLGKSGQVVGGIPAAEMWDSRKDPKTGDRVKHVKAKQWTANRAGPSQDGVDITVEPADGFFDDPELVYPVMIDPSPEIGAYFDTWVQEGSTLQKSASTELRMGTTSGLKTRAYMQFDMTPIQGATVTASTLRLWAFHSYSCAARNWTVWSMPTVTWDVTWASMPQPWTNWTTTSETKGYDANCADGWTNTDNKALAEAWAKDKFGMAGVMIRATDETDSTAWKKFNSAEAGSAPNIQVTYYTPPPPNNAPGVPSDLGLEAWGGGSSDALACATGAGRPRVGTRTPRLRARVTDADGGMLKAGFRWYEGTIGALGPWNNVDYTIDNVDSGSWAEVTVTAGHITHDGTYAWQLWASDDIATTWSTTACEFEIDTVKPSVPAVSSSDYPTTGVNGSVGRTGMFTFSTNGNTGLNGSMDVAHYKWSINSDAKNNRVDVTSTDGTVAVPITPTNELQNVLYVQAYDRANNPSSNHAVYTFAANSATGPVASWEVTEASGTTTADSTGNGRPLTLLGGSSFGTGYAGNGLSTGSGGYASSTGPIVHTDKAFAVAAWVKIDSASGYVTVASQSGNRVSGFYLQHSADVNRWTMSVVGSDVDNPSGLLRVKSVAPPQVGVWTHLIGTYEPNSKTVSLYVNGKLEGTGTATLFDAQGAFLVGASKWNGQLADFFPGTIDQVQVWDRTVSTTEAALIANKWFARMRYRLDETAGTSAPDTVGNDTGTLSGGVSWAGTPVDPDDPNQVLTSEDKWARFDAAGTGQISASKGTKFRADRSYTVMSWMKLSDKSDARTVLAMEHSGHSPFSLGYRQDSDKWCLVTQTSTGTSPVQACSDHPAPLNTWVHLAATYDMVTGKVTLYVDGIRQSVFYGTADGGGVSAWQPNGGFLIGRGQLNGAITQPWRGDLDDVRIYTGVLSGAEIGLRIDESIHG